MLDTRKIIILYLYGAGSIEKLPIGMENNWINRNKTDKHLMSIGMGKCILNKPRE